MKTRRYIIRIGTHLFHNVYLTVIRPCCKFDRHHPESRPCALALRQLYLCLNISVCPTRTHITIETCGIDLSIFLEALYAQFTILQICHTCSGGCLFLYISLQLIVHPSWISLLICPQVAIGIRPRVELVVPHQLISIKRTGDSRRIWDSITTSLRHLYIFTRSTSHNSHHTLTTVIIAILLHFDRQCGILLS